MENPNDRGTIKWTSLILPEHVEMVQEIFKEQEREEKLQLDEQQLQDNALALEMALKDILTVKFPQKLSETRSLSGQQAEQ
ncbi:YolD-like family protein [Halobacillus massiliensis]|uniref:YolD-like family protein n=1 Tax=Halobacillus massiliensis TaxID=1926286 RepID=UPI0009E3F184|nr:YolD-like family protein [Halobacillus massiliensis]